MSDRIASTEIAERLVRELGYTEKAAFTIAPRLAVLVEPAAAAFADWWRSGRLDGGVEAAGVSLTQLQEQHGMNVIAAILTLDWLARSPSEATAALRRGFDRIKG